MGTGRDHRKWPGADPALNTRRAKPLGWKGPLEQPGHPGEGRVPSAAHRSSRPATPSGGRCTQPGGREEAQLPLLTRRPAAAGSPSPRGLGPFTPPPPALGRGLQASFWKPARLSPPPPPSGQDAWLSLTDFTSRRSPPGAAEGSTKGSLVLPTVSAARQGAGEPHLPLVPCWHGLVEVKPRGTCVLVTCSSSMIYEGQLSNLCFSIYQLHCHLPMLVLERFQSSLCP